MRKGADSFGRPVAGHASRGVRRPRRDEAVWLVTDARHNLAGPALAPHTSGALALERAPATAISARPRCALIVEGAPTLAAALAAALQARFEPARQVRHIATDRSPVPDDLDADVTVVDAPPAGDADEWWRRLRAAHGAEHIQPIFVTTGASSYALSQRGVTTGIVLREPHCLDEIVDLAEEALGDA